MPPFVVAFDRAMSFKGGYKRPLVLVGDDGVARLKLFQRELVSALDKTGIGRHKHRPYNPHITLLHDEHRIPDQPVEAISWIVREVVLVCAVYRVKAGILCSPAGHYAAELPQLTGLLEQSPAVPIKQAHRRAAICRRI